MSECPVFVAVDVAKDALDVAVRPGDEHWSVANDDAGGAALAAAGLPLVVAKPRQVRDVVRATGQLPKTDQLDAGILAF